MYKLGVIIFILFIICQSIFSYNCGHPAQLTFRPVCCKCKTRTAQGVINPNINIQFEDNPDTVTELLLCRECSKNPVSEVPAKLAVSLREPPLRSESPKRETSKLCVDEIEYEDDDYCEETKSVASKSDETNCTDNDDTENIIGDLVVRVCNRFIDKIRKAQKHVTNGKCKTCKTNKIPVDTCLPAVKKKKTKVRVY